MIKIHKSFASFVKIGFKQKSTYIGLVILIFGWLYYKDINELIHHVLDSSRLTDCVINGLATVVGGSLVIFKGRNKK